MIYRNTYWNANIPWPYVLVGPAGTVVRGYWSIQEAKDSGYPLRFKA